MRVEQVDPRTARWEQDYPAYRVYFWQTTAENPGVGWASDEWRLRDADVHDVITWAADHADGRYCTIWAEISAAGEPGLLRLSGWEPTRPDSPPKWVTAWK